MAWILATNQYRVLLIDWDLEAPGLHRYFAPLLADAELESSSGLTDLLWDFIEAAYDRESLAELEWYAPLASFHNLSRYIVSLRTNGETGRLDLLPAGKQGPSYGTRVTGFEWDTFYQRLGGGLFLDAAMAELRQQYDFVLIDSRTGVSDTSGICTIQLPDFLVTCFTLNRQSILGAAAASQSALAQRAADRPLPVFAVPCRIEDGESERRQAMLRFALGRFSEMLSHIEGGVQPYWARAQLKYKIRHAYEEQLAALTDDPDENGTVLQSCEFLSANLAGRPGLRVRPISEELKRQIVQGFLSIAGGHEPKPSTSVSEDVPPQESPGAREGEAAPVASRPRLFWVAVAASASVLVGLIVSLTLLLRGDALAKARSEATVNKAALDDALGKMTKLQETNAQLNERLKAPKPPDDCDLRVQEFKWKAATDLLVQTQKTNAALEEANKLEKQRDDCQTKKSRYADELAKCCPNSPR